MSKKIKILFYLEAFDKGGIEKVTLDLVNNLNPDKYDITVLQKFKGGYCRSQLKPYIKKKCCFPLFANGISRIFMYLPGKILYKIFVREKYDIEIACGDGGPSSFIAGSNNPKSKKISWVHMDVTKVHWPIYDYKTEERRKKLYNNFDKIVCVSNDCKENFVNMFGEEDKCIVQYNPIPKDDVIHNANELLDIEINKNIINIVSVGRLVEQKGYDRLLEVHKKLIDEGIYHNLYIIGDGKERESLNKYILDNKLDNSVKLLGFKTNPYKYINMSDVFICSSRHESFSIVVAESIILGKAIVSTKCCGPTELLGNGEYGILVENSTKGLYEGIKMVLTQKDTINHYSKKSKQRSEIFDFYKCIKQWEEIIDNV